MHTGLMDSAIPRGISLIYVHTGSHMMHGGKQKHLEAGFIITTRTYMHGPASCFHANEMTAYVYLLCHTHTLRWINVHLLLLERICTVFSAV